MHSGFMLNIFVRKVRAQVEKVFWLNLQNCWIIIQKIRNAYLMPNLMRLFHFEYNQAKIRSLISNSLFFAETKYNDLTTIIRKFRKAFLNKLQQLPTLERRVFVSINLCFYLKFREFVNLN